MREETRKAWREMSKYLDIISQDDERSLSERRQAEVMHIYLRELMKAIAADYDGNECDLRRDIEALFANPNIDPGPTYTELFRKHGLYKHKERSGLCSGLRGL